MKRNLAFYKKDGKPWTFDELNRVSIYVGDGAVDKFIEDELFDSICDKKYIYDDGDDLNYMCLWCSQEDDPNFKNCKKIAYEDVFNEKETK